MTGEKGLLSTIPGAPDPAKRSPEGRPSISGLAAEHGLDELFRNEVAQIFRPLADADVTHRELVLGANAENHATFRRSVELGQDDTRKGQRIFEECGLLHRILT